MKNLFVVVLLALAALLFGQSTYEQSMQTAIQTWENATLPDDLLATAQAYEQISKNYPDKWEPLYYSIYFTTNYAYTLPATQAIKLADELLDKQSSLAAIYNNEEIILLKGIILTIKVAKDPMKFGPTLSSRILSLYHKARNINSKNPRVMYKLAEYEILGAPYMGRNPKDFCPLLEETLKLFEKEENTEAKGYEPRWGQARAIDLYETTCK